MKLSAGMVLVQSLNQLGRVCFQISKGSYSSVREFLEEFLNKWHFVDGKHYVLVGSQVDAYVQRGCDERNILGIDEYMEVVEIFVVTILGTTLKDLDLAITWVEKAALPEERRQGLLRRLHSLNFVKATNSAQVASVLPANSHEACGPSSKENFSGRSSELKTHYLADVVNSNKESILKFSRRVEPRFCWFRSVNLNLKFGNARLAITNGKIMLGCLMFLIYYALRRKRATLKRYVGRQVSSIKKALVDLWQLTFSYQVNPLAAVQSLPAAT